MAGDLENRVAIVTGAGDIGGIGWETARVLAAAGAKVVLADLPSTDLAGAAAAIAEAGETAHRAVDLADESSIKELIAFAVERYGRLDILDNNAAAVSPNPFDDGHIADMSTKIWDLVHSVNARGTMLMCKHAIPHMLAAGRGSIINITSDTYVAGDDFPTAYACSKATIPTLSRYIAAQYGLKGIRCNTISPGLMKSAKMVSTMPPPVQEVFRQQTLVGRLGEPRDIAEAVLFLASDRASFITGEVIHVNGGMLAHMPAMNALRQLQENFEA